MSEKKVCQIEFEKWAEELKYDLTLSGCGLGTYDTLTTELAWCTWKAAWNAAITWSLQVAKDVLS